MNDTYRIEGLPESGQGGLARLRTLRTETQAAGMPALLLHAGDLLYPSLLSSSYGGEQMIDVMNRLDGDATAFDDHLFVVFGNHEFDKKKLKDGQKLDARVEESQFTWLSSNITFANGDDGLPIVDSEHLAPRALVDLDGIKVGIFGLTTPAKVPDFVSTIDDPAETARAEVALLRSHGAEFVIALTHLEVRNDLALLTSLEGPLGPDLIVGGHDHQSMIEQVGDRYVVKGDADAVSAVRTIVRRQGAGFAVTPERVALGPDAYPPEPTVQASIDGWIARHQRDFCSQAKIEDGCLDATIGRTTVPLIAEELLMRRFETNTGDWLADLARGAYPDQGVQVALINSGSIRLNRNVAAGPLTRRHLEELLPYPTGLKIVDVPGKVLRDAVLQHAIEDWTGNGWFLHVSGLGFTHDVATGTIRDVWIADGHGKRPIRDDETVRVVTTDYLVDPTLGNRDGYTMIDVAWAKGGDATLKDLALGAVRAAGDAGISPAADGRICTTSERACP